VRLPASNDTRLLVVGVAVFVALVVYLGVAFAAERTPVNIAKELAPWLPHGSTLTPIPHRTGRGFTVRVTPDAPGSWGALVSTVINSPTRGAKFRVGFSLRGSRPGSVGVEIDEFAPGASSVYVVEKTVPATRSWHRYTFSGRVTTGSWLGMGMYVYRQTATVRPWFEVRGLTASLTGG
jgi:hypothetical protein